MKRINFLLFLFLCSCGKEVNLTVTEEDALMENPESFTDEEIFQHFLLHDPTFVDPPVTSIGDE